MIVYRLVRKDRTSLDGEGAALFPGRWNPVNVPCLYTSATPSLAQLEVMVNVDDWQLFIKVPHFILHIQIPTNLVKEIAVSDLPSDWNTAAHSPSTQKFGATLLTDPGILAFSVPSALSPLERNIIINPGSTSFHKILIKKRTPFVFDTRLMRG